ncbi:MAG: hypothetical protein AVDCRST_MAG42-1358 [uncultured Chthoniobacterales bacterium]|uniref:Glucose/Sorbosone dehydrogenase domain-containing protein n=1 Tax=uncultured Chthoniobacterales bacterium TaxID=1836801 RepID=A0A6J4HHC6_9BACT|nr:MAG: hypothetical protein AVDCRST_MAG42-1358 [uncultured Chthoniobacterales bacterium]
MNRHISIIHRATCAAFCIFTVGFAQAQLPSIPSGTISIELQQVATGLASPVDLVSPNDGTGRLFVVEQGGTIRVLKNGTLNASPFLNISAQIKAGGEQGLLGLAFHPGFSNSASPGFRKLYTYQTENPSTPADFTVPASRFENQCVVTEWQVSAANPDVVDPGTRRDVIRIDHPQGNHNGGEIGFRPSDGYLYIAIGDGGSGGDVGDGHTPNLGNAQDTSNLLGKILRIDPLAPALNPTADPVAGNGKYRNPANNPFVGAPGREEIYAFGFRNPYRFSFDPVADQLIVGDVGQGAIEEVDVVDRGGNYGWNRKEGSFLYNGGSVSPDPNPNPAFINPVLEYDHDDGISVIAGFTYRGAAVPALAGKYVFGDFLRRGTSGGRLFYGDLNARTIQELRLGVNPRAFGMQIKGFGTDDAGEIYVLGDSGSTGGQVLKIVPIPATPALLNLSTRLRAETGENVGISGFILTGSAPKNIAIRGIGPSISHGGQKPASDRLLNPAFTLFDASGAPIGGNDDWMSAARRQEVIDRGLAPSDQRESAEIFTLQPGVYTAVIQGANGESGVALIELYDLDQGGPGNLVNISTRGRVETDEQVLIGGFIIGGTQAQRVMVRALGPSLSGRGIAGALQNPTLELVNSSGTAVGSNDNWRSDQEKEISESGLPPSSDAESAIIRSLTPGQYTGVVRGVGDSTGVALVEVYRLNP